MYGTYRNRHNGREITIDRLEIGDTGIEFWYCGEYSFFTRTDLQEHWVLLGDEEE